MEPRTRNELFWVYDSLTGRYAAIHREGCGFCNRGEGIGGGYNRQLALWRGPFRSLDEAAQHVFARPETVQQMRYCRRCV
jgi:F-type H+-transporting ATPase subunit beta